MHHNKYGKEAKEAQEERRKWRSCEGKKRYETEKHAEIINQTTYECRYCNGWHRSASLFTKVRMAANRHKRSGS